MIHQILMEVNGWEIYCTDINGLIALTKFIRSGEIHKSRFDMGNSTFIDKIPITLNEENRNYISIFLVKLRKEMFTN